MEEPALHVQEIYAKPVTIQVSAQHARITQQVLLAVIVMKATTTYQMFALHVPVICAKTVIVQEFV
jgi:hypothetical protein